MLKSKLSLDELIHALQLFTNVKYRLDDKKGQWWHTKFLRLHFEPFGSTPTTLSREER